MKLILGDLTSFGSRCLDHIPMRTGPTLSHSRYIPARMGREEELAKPVRQARDKEGRGHLEGTQRHMQDAALAPGSLDTSRRVSVRGRGIHGKQQDPAPGDVQAGAGPLLGRLDRGGQPTSLRHVPHKPRNCGSVMGLGKKEPRLGSSQQPGQVRLGRMCGEGRKGGVKVSVPSTWQGKGHGDKPESQDAFEPLSFPALVSFQKAAPPPSAANCTPGTASFLASPDDRGIGL